MSQQLVKKGANGRMEHVNPRSWIEAIKDKNTGQTLVEILQGFNMYFLPYNGNTSSTRCLVPTMLRKKGLWITYVKYDGNVYTEWYAADELDDKSWGDSSNWRVGNNTLVGDITISANGNWVINGTETEFKAVGEKGNTPLIRVANNRLQVSYDLGDTYRDVTNNPVYTKFRWLATSGDTQANNVGRIQASTDEGKTWTNMSNDFTNNLHISRYIGVNESLPTSGIAEGTIYAKGPYYAEDDTLNDNPIYRLWVYAWKGNTLAWQDNGEFQSIAAGVVQETGDSETKVMSQKATTEKLAELGSKMGISSNIELNGYVKEIYCPDLDYTQVNEVKINLGTPTGNKYYNSVYLFYLENGVRKSKNLYQKEYDTQEECRDNCVGYKTGNDGAVIIDFSGYDSYGTKNYTPVSLNHATDLNNNPSIAVNILQTSKQDLLEFDALPIKGSNNIVNSNGIYNSILNALSPLINAGYLLAGVAKTSDNAYTPTSKQMKFAFEEGVYPAYGNLQVRKGETCLFYYTNSEWGKLVLQNVHNLPMTNDWRFDRCVKELYLTFDYSEISKIRLIYAAVTGSRWYNAMHIFTESGTLVMFSEEYTTQEECIRQAKGMKWNYELNIGAVIDYSLLTVGTYNEFTPIFNQEKNIPLIESRHGLSTIWTDTEYLKSFFEKAICIGDSITEGNIYDYGKYMGVGLKSKLSYPAHLAKNTGWECENAGESGITTINWWINKFGNYNYSEYDVAFIALGTNGGLTDTIETDAPIGTSYENYANTNTGRYCSIVEGIRMQNPNIVIALIVMPINYNSVTRDTIYAIAERYNLPVLDMTDNTYYNLLRTPSLHGKSNSTTSDLTHFNAIGYCVLAHCIMASFFNWCQLNYQYVNDFHKYEP